jgi:hypothetical protein
MVRAGLASVQPIATMKEIAILGTYDIEAKKKLVKYLVGIKD